MCIYFMFAHRLLHDELWWKKIVTYIYHKIGIWDFFRQYIMADPTWTKTFKISIESFPRSRLQILKWLWQIQFSGSNMDDYNCFASKIVFRRYHIFNMVDPIHIEVIIEHFTSVLLSRDFRFVGLRILNRFSQIHYGRSNMVQ